MSQHESARVKNIFQSVSLIQTHFALSLRVVKFVNPGIKELDALPYKTLSNI